MPILPFIDAQGLQLCRSLIQGLRILFDGQSILAVGRFQVWSQEETDYLLENYQKESITNLSLALDKSYSAISQKLYKLRLSSTGRQLKEIVTNPKVQVKVEFSNLPVFHPVMIGIYPNRNHYYKKSRIWQKRRAIVLKMHDWCCAYCGDYADSVDHVIPVDKGGLDTLDNLVAACNSCNSSFGTKTKHIRWICDPIHIPHSEIMGKATHEPI